MPEEGFYEEILNTDSELFGGSQHGQRRLVSSRPVPQHNRPHSIAVTLPPLAVVAFARSAERMPQRYDAIIIGGGHNGLVTAAYLARAGRKVLVLERRELVGGCAVTEEIWPGYRVSTAAYLTSLLQERIVRELDLARFGYQVDAKDPGLLLRLSRRPPLLHVAGSRRRRWPRSPNSRAHDAEVYPAYEDQLERLSQVVEALLLTTPPQFPPRGLGDFIDYLKLAGRLRGLSAGDMVALVKIFTQSAAEFLDEWFESEEVKVTLATDGVIGANGGPRSPGTAYILLHHCMGGVAGHRGLWGFVRGGMGAVSEAIAASARAAGAEIRTNAPVAKVLVRDGRACGVVLESGEEIEAGVVASNLDPKVTFLRCSTSAISTRISSRPSATSASKAPRCKINLALNGLPEFTAYPGAPGPQHRATMHICPIIEYVERAWDDAKYGRPSRAPAAGTDHPHHVRPVARAARQAHHGHLPAIRALHAARGHLGRAARAVRRPRDLADRGVRAQHPLASSSTGRC